MHGALRSRLGEVLGDEIRSISSLSGGCVGEVYRVETARSGTLVAKVADGAGAALSVEGRMLDFLREHSGLPVPEVIHASDDLLLMTLIETGGSLDDDAERHAADLIAALHRVTPEVIGRPGRSFGFDFDTLIGGLHQPNTWSESWISFFADMRLRFMAAEAARAGRLPAAMVRRVEQLCQRLDGLLIEPASAALIHGDLWGGNVLTCLSRSGCRISGFIDPAICFAHPEIELAFSTLFSTFGEHFFRRYREHHTIADGFFEERRDLYNLYPLLVHVRLFGGGYVGSVDGVLRRFGC